MARRYSGDLEINIRLLSDNETYNVNIRTQDREVRFPPQKGIRLSPYAAARIAADSARAFDEVARVAVSFCADEPDSEVVAFARLDDEGNVLVQRKYAGEDVLAGVCGT